MKKTNVWRGVSMVSASLLTVSLLAGNILETYRTSVDAFVGTRSQKTVTESSDNEEDSWNYKSAFKTAKEAYEGFKEYAILLISETYAAS